MIVQTEVLRSMLARMRATHEASAISIFSGPPGIGKTTAIDLLKRELGPSLARVKISRNGAREVFTMQRMIEAIGDLGDTASPVRSASFPSLQLRLFSSICNWMARVVASGQSPPRLTVVFDEAQNLSRRAIEWLRYWNDGDECHSPVPLGLIFIGNHEFSLAPSHDGESQISEAVSDRVLFSEQYDYRDVHDEDLLAFAQDLGVPLGHISDQIMGHFSGRSQVRSFRRITRLVEEARLKYGETFAPPSGHGLE